MPVRVTLTAEEARRLGIRAPVSKYRSKRTVVDGHSFASKKEAQHYGLLCGLVASGAVLWFAVQPKFLVPGGSWKSDFIVAWADGSVQVLDVKGHFTPEHKRITKIVMARYPKLRIEYV